MCVIFEIAHTYFLKLNFVKIIGSKIKFNRKLPCSSCRHFNFYCHDTDFNSIFSRQIQGIGDSGDVLIGISTSGNSENVINAIRQANFKKLKTITLTGKTAGKIDGLADITIKVPSDNTQRIQECHIMIGQILCSLVEESVL